jgi:hypothetical protein
MTNQAKIARTMVHAAVAALFATAASMAIAGDGASDRPSRALDDQPVVKFRGATTEPGRKLDDDGIIVKQRGATDRPGRELSKEDERKTVKARGPSDRPGRTAEDEEGTVKAGGSSDKPGRTVDASK